MTWCKYGVLVLCLGLAAGCHATVATKGDPESTDFRELGDLWHAAAGKAGRPPAKLADLTPYQKMFPKAYDSVKSGNVVVLWGTAPKGEGDVGSGNEQVLAYEKKAPTEGGYVLMSAGTIKQMSASEFNAAVPKGKK
jgi:hypothetical protein